MREVAHHHLNVQTGKEREVFWPAEVAHQVIEQSGSLCHKSMTRRAKALVRPEEDEVMSSHLLSLSQQGRMMSKFEGNAAALWSKCVGRLPPEPLSFVLNATVSHFQQTQISSSGENDLHHHVHSAWVSTSLCTSSMTALQQ